MKQIKSVDFTLGNIIVEYYLTNPDGTNEYQDTLYYDTLEELYNFWCDNWRHHYTHNSMTICVYVNTQLGSRHYIINDNTDFIECIGRLVINLFNGGNSYAIR